MLKKLAAGFVLTAFIAAVNGTVLAGVNDGDKNGPQTASESRKPLKDKTFETSYNITGTKSTLAEHQKSAKQHKRFSTTTKVMIGAGIASAIVAVVVVLAKRDVERNIWR